MVPARSPAVSKFIGVCMLAVFIGAYLCWLLKGVGVRKALLCLGGLGGMIVWMYLAAALFTGKIVF